ncbi:LuxR C-terminal-related transcriptional regulator [Mycobacterium sp. 2YAF39]|uniref:helix-turn-helix transcriptional regulator n=1 Tax=Mycobacterium sp. 2YAF39 TaxID=3233033 RepID=UPI003F9EB756
MSATEWSELGVSGLPTGTVTLLLADVEGSTRLWEAQPKDMSSAIRRLDETLAQLMTVHNGVRPIEQGEGDSFVLAFARASDAVACALALQRAPLAPIRLRIGINTGEIQLRDEGNYIGPTINRTARLRDLGHGGQTLLSGATEAMVVDHLPADSWLNDLGTHALRDLPRPERVVQLCHPDIHNDFPPLRVAKTVTIRRLPTHLTSFVGREPQIAEVRRMLNENRLVTLTGAGGAGKTRLAVEVADRMAEFGDGTWYVDLAPITVPELVPVTAARALGLAEQQGSSAMDTIVQSVSGRTMLLILDNCEHLLDASAALITTVLDRCPGVTLLTTSREPIGVPGEVTWRVPSLPSDSEALSLFVDRARRARPDFTVTDDNIASVTELCRRLDGMPLAIELAAARIRALSLNDILDSLHDRFRLLTGGSRTAVRRQQTLRASVDWSHALLTEAERVLFRRLAPFMDGFDLDAAQTVGGGDDVERYQVLDMLGLLVDKSLVIAEERGGRTRYRLLETVRQYASEKLGESGEAGTVRSRHRDHYVAVAAALNAPAGKGYEQLLEQMECEIDNLRAAFAWSLEGGEIETAMGMAVSLTPLWIGRGKLREGLAWLDLAFDAEKDSGVEAAASTRAWAMAEKALLGGVVLGVDRTELADQAIAIAREAGDPVVLAWTLSARARGSGRDAVGVAPFIAEAIALAREADHGWILSQVFARQATLAIMSSGDPVLARTAAEEGLEIADAIGNGYDSRQCRWCLGMADWFQGNLAEAGERFTGLAEEATAQHDPVMWAINLAAMSYALLYQGDTAGARAASVELVESDGELLSHAALGHAGLALVAAAEGDTRTAHREAELAWPQPGIQRDTVVITILALTTLQVGDIVTARQLADEAVSQMSGWHRSMALNVRARVALAEGRPDLAETDVHDALTSAVEVQIRHSVPDILELRAALACGSGSHQEAARLFGAADSLRRRTGEVQRFVFYQPLYEESCAEARKALRDAAFRAAWDEGAALSFEEAIAYAQRGRGERKRPSSGWDSLTPTEVDVVRLVQEGLGNKDIAARLFISHRTVQTHLTHVYTKLGLSSRVQLAQEAARQS